MPPILQGPPFPSSSPSSGAGGVQELSHFFVTPASIHPLSCPLQPEDKLDSALKASRRGKAQSRCPGNSSEMQPRWWCRGKGVRGGWGPSRDGAKCRSPCSHGAEIVEVRSHSCKEVLAVPIWGLEIASPKLRHPSGGSRADI